MLQIQFCMNNVNKLLNPWARAANAYSQRITLNKKNIIGFTLYGDRDIKNFVKKASKRAKEIRPNKSKKKRVLCLR